MADGAPLQRTPLYEEHLRAGARLVDFHGWELPLQYAGILAEHAAVRGAYGAFDVSHMGQSNVAVPAGLEPRELRTQNLCQQASNKLRKSVVQAR